MAGVVIAGIEALCTSAVTASLGIGCAAIINGNVEKSDDSDAGWIAFGIILAVFAVCVFLQCFYWRRQCRKAESQGGDASVAYGLLWAATPCVFAPLGFFFGFLIAYLRMQL
eukprot:CAMPEP_0114638942 /NCGR_PEP_ID=MMETSP0191-20121206/893_1 /TAXON_ID=126664 /ORGANISM="Sorites sp." /LENGTH=111 /DNA_ID=CAMNT_0001850751 /DNA_START=47 /DNA_END=382 /DNA_ORIENTATION=+